MSNPRFGAESRIDFASTLKAWSVAREVTGALRAGMGWTPERADGWSEEYRASTSSADFDEGDSLEELRAVWRENHLDLGQFWATFVARGVEVPADRVFMALVNGQNGSWTAFLEFEGSHSIALRTFTINFVAGMKRSIEPNFPGLKASLSEPAVQSAPQRVRGPRTPKSKEDVLAEVFGASKPKVDVVSEVRAIVERGAEPDAVGLVQTLTQTEPKAVVPVVKADHPAEPRQEKPPVARRGRILRRVGSTTERVVLASVGAAVTTIVGATTAPWWWPF